MPNPADWVAAEGPQMRVPLASIKRLFRDRNGVLWDLGATNVIDAKRIRNPAKPGFVKVDMNPLDRDL